MRSQQSQTYYNIFEYKRLLYCKSYLTGRWKVDYGNNYLDTTYIPIKPLLAYSNENLAEYNKIKRILNATGLKFKVFNDFKIAVRIPRGSKYGYLLKKIAHTYYRCGSLEIEEDE